MAVAEPGMSWQLPFKALPFFFSFSYSSLVSTYHQTKCVISGWIHKFADTAEKALITEFTQQGIQTQEKRAVQGAVFVQNPLGNADDMSDKKCPFIWESAYDDPDIWQEVRFQIGSGLPLILVHSLLFRGFSKADSSHEYSSSICKSSKWLMPGTVSRRSLLAALSIPFKWFVCSLTSVAILKSGQVHHALLHLVTGSLQLPTDKKSAKFSKTNWGEHTLVTPHEEKFIKCASVFLNKISTFKDQQWDDIYEKALAFQVVLGKQVCNGEGGGYERLWATEGSQFRIQW